MTLRFLIKNIAVWKKWQIDYNKFVPLFIDEAIANKDWRKWDKDVFYEFFEKPNDQCVSSLLQGYFNGNEKAKIKQNWAQISGWLHQIASNQTEPQSNAYEAVKTIIRKYTDKNKKAATHRLIAGLQPELLCTIVDESKLEFLFSFLRKNVTGFDANLSGNWFTDSNAIITFYKSQLGASKASDIMTLPWQTYELIKSKNFNLSDMIANFEKHERIKPLIFKRQVVLQGPPGTGKTKLAKEFAHEIIGTQQYGQSDILSPQDIRECLRIGLEVKSVSDSSTYVVKEITDTNVRLFLPHTNKTYSPSVRQIFDYYKSKKWNDRTDSGGTHPYSAAIAKYLDENVRKIDIENSDQFKLIQFHPSYSYEDFVRGIVARPNENGEGILYEAENKTLAVFAERALLNYQNSKQDNTVASKELWVDRNFKDFVSSIAEELESGVIALTDNVNLISIDNDAFRYKGVDGWAKNGNRMRFADIKQSYINGDSERQDIVQNERLSGLANWHATYYLKVLEMYKAFLERKNLKFSEDESSSEKPKNYVLVIDEINRANLSSVLGELIYALEYRGDSIGSMYSINGRNKIILPPNLYIIGTMNTADRSVGTIDYAIRRRFAFIEVLPKDLSNEKDIVFATTHFKRISELFVSNLNEYLADQSVPLIPADTLSPEFRPEDVWLGHSYFIDKSSEGGDMETRLRYEIKPILLEYVKDGILVSSNKIADIKKFIHEL